MLSCVVLPRMIQTEGGCFRHSVCIHPVWVFPLEKSEITVGSNHAPLMAARLPIHCAAIISQERRLQGFWRISDCLLVSLFYFMAVYNRKAHMEAHILVWMQHKQNTQRSEYLHWHLAAVLLYTSDCLPAKPVIHLSQKNKECVWILEQRWPSVVLQKKKIILLYSRLYGQCANIIHSVVCAWEESLLEDLDLEENRVA